MDVFIMYFIYALIKPKMFFVAQKTKRFQSQSH